MKTLKIIFAIVFLVSSYGSHASELGKLKFTITTFNIRFYGLTDNDKRDKALEDFLKDSIPSSDLMVLEEIVDVPRVKKILPNGWDCLSYDSDRADHQHVVICHSSRFNLVREETDDNDVIDEVAGPKGTLRPALTAIVTDKSGKKLFRVVGVHLKASPEYSKLRVSQSKIIADYLSEVKKSDLPVVITGDFNTYKNDTNLILNAFNSNDLVFKRIPNEFFTFRNPKTRGRFDHFYISESMSAVSPLKVFEICNQDGLSDEEMLGLTFYNQNISDHCPVTAEISL